MKAPSRRKTGSSNLKIVDLREAAGVFKVDPMKLFKLVRSGAVPGTFQVGLLWRVDLDYLEGFLNNRPSTHQT
jgi:hypothetical protein